MVGIINGTTNFILTKMSNEKADYKATLQLAQKLGFAEFDPTADVEGHDAADKISILSELAFGGKINRDSISTEGINQIDIKDIEYANKLGFEIKLLAFSERNAININDSLSLNIWVGPSLIPKSHPLATVDGVNNAILIDADPLGEIMLYGPGAGKWTNRCFCCF
jgi:homoserine dehydrogenase